MRSTGVNGTKSVQTHQSYSLRLLLEVFNKFPETAGWALGHTMDTCALENNFLE